MRVEQALYGEVAGGGHGLRCASPNALVAPSIASKLDLPDTVPRGVQNWAPFVRGFPFQDHYVLARTFQDLTSSRGGMVVTHALIVKLDEMSEVSTLAELFAALPSTAAECIGPLEHLEVKASAGIIPMPSADLIGTANSLVAGGASPVVRIGVAGFEGLVDSLWRNLWPTIRRSFSFRLSLGPSDVVEQPAPALVCTPEQLQGRWINHQIVKPGEQTLASESAKILVGARPSEQIMELAEDLGIDVNTFKVLGRLERLHTLLSAGDTFDNLLAAIRLTDGLSPRPTLGISRKNQLMRRFEDMLPKAQGKQLLPLRNLTLSGFPDSSALWTAVEQAICNLDFAPVDDAAAMEIVAASVSSDQALAPWRDAIGAGLSAAAYRKKPSIFAAIWRWAKLSQPTFAIAIDSLPKATEIEQLFVQAAPKSLNVTTQSKLLSTLVQKRWLIAHGAALSAMFGPLEAAERQLAVDLDQTHSAGLRIALQHASPTQTLECTVALKDVRLIELCADLAATTPQILADIRGEDLTEQKVWATSIGKSASLWNAPRNAASVRDAVMAQLVAGLQVEPNLLMAFSQTPLADLSTTPERAGLWSHIPTPLRAGYLEATANAWLEAATGLVVTLPEAILETAILASAKLQPALENSRKPLETRLAIISALQSFREDAFVTWVGITLHNFRILSPAQAEHLGGLIASRGWKQAAEELVKQHNKYRPDLLPSLRKCANLLGFYQCWKLGISKPTVSEKWVAFEREACELYPDGPDTAELWSRAGGKKYELPGGYLNGVARWHSALSSVRYGSRPSARALLLQMCEDFPGNEKLRLYSQDVDIVGRQ